MKPTALLCTRLLTASRYSIKKPKTNRYPSLNGTDPKFRRNHRHALHGTMKALVRSIHLSQSNTPLTTIAEGGEGGHARLGLEKEQPRAIRASD